MKNISHLTTPELEKMERIYEFNYTLIGSAILAGVRAELALRKDIRDEDSLRNQIADLMEEIRFKDDYICDQSDRICELNERINQMSLNSIKS